VSGAWTRLILLLVLLWGISALEGFRDALGTPVTLAGGALLLCGLFAGKVARGYNLPRLTGYLLIGILVGPYAFGFIPLEGVAGLSLVKGLAVSLIALTAGTELRFGLIRRVGREVLILSLLVCGLVFAVAWVVIILLRPWLPFMEGMTLSQALAVSALIASVVVSFSPTVTIAVVQEMRAKGALTEFLMAMVIIGDLLVLITFALAAGLTRASLGGSLELGALVGGVFTELFGSIFFGAVLGLGTLLYLRQVRREVPLFIVALCFLSAEAGVRLHLSPLLIALAAGTLIGNGDEREGERLNHATQQASLPVFALFFAASGAGLELGALRIIGPVAILLVLVRGTAIYYGSRLFARREDVRRFVWMGLISQAGVTFGLAALVRRTFPSFGAGVEVLIVAMVTVHELIGPVLLRRALVKTGEAHAEPDLEPA
jgi:Kef-type K+ transport system membrane component KefB